ncbi:MAG: thioesterase family protein [Actinomycetota bacterium]
MHLKKIEIRWSDLDAFCHVNNAVYLNYLEEVRDEFLNLAVAPTGSAWDFVLVRVAIDYRRELKEEDQIVVASCALTSIGTASVTTHEEIRTLTGDLAAEAEAVMVARDRETGKSRPLTDIERAGIERV